MTAVTVGLVAAVTGTARGQTTNEGYGSLVERYRSGDSLAVHDLLRSGITLPRDPCRGPEQCAAAAVLNLEAAALLLGARRADDAAALVDETREMAARASTDFAFEWLLAAGYVRQAPGDHARAFGFYLAALELRPRDPSALLARASALECSAIPDGFGGASVADQAAWGFLGADDPPAALALRLADQSRDDPYRRRLLDVLARQYREVLRLDPRQAEARLRLGRVLLEQRRHGEALKELRAAANPTAEPFVAAVARLCLARLEADPGATAVAYRSALEIDPDLQPAWLGLSQVLQASGDRDGAVAALARTIARVGPRRNAWAEYHCGRGRAFPQALASLRARVVGSR